MPAFNVRTDFNLWTLNLCEYTIFYECVTTLKSGISLCGLKSMRNCDFMILTFATTFWWYICFIVNLEIKQTWILKANKRKPIQISYPICRKCSRSLNWHSVVTVSMESNALPWQNSNTVRIIWSAIRLSAYFGWTANRDNQPLLSRQACVLRHTVATSSLRNIRAEGSFISKSGRALRWICVYAVSFGWVRIKYGSNTSTIQQRSKLI